MSKITTEDCKSFILKKLSLDNSIKIKRLKKYKNEDGLYVRDFEISNGQSCSILEQNDGSLLMMNTNNSKKSFNAKELSAASRHLNLIDLYMNIGKEKNQGIIDDDVQDMINNNEIRPLLPSQFWFNFPEGIHSNTKENIKNGLDSPFIFKSDNSENSDSINSDSLCFKIIPRNEEFHENYLLLETINPLLKSDFILIDECHYQLNPSSKNKHMTVKEIIEYLEKFGFTYKKEIKNNSLCLFGEYIPEETNKKPFDAKKYLRKILKSMENDEDDKMEEEISTIRNMSDEDKTKIANEFYFYFPDGTYNNDIKNITNGLDTLMYQPNRFGEYMCFTFHDSLKSEPDFYLSSLTLGILPSYFDLVDEYNFEPNSYKQKNPEEINNLTIRDVIKILQDLGFKYKNDKNAGECQCMLHKLNIKVL